jgi:MinD-like ATPase involved in chromosome partitioning or flagellar assembly
VRNGQIITIFAAKGGCGKTTLATNLAVVLHDGGARRVCLVDLDLESGDIASTLGLIPARSLADAIRYTGQLDAARIASLMTSFRVGLDCLLAPAAPGDFSRIPVSLVSELLALLPDVYDYVVVDTPARFSSYVLAALDAAHHQVLLTTPERPALKNLRLTLDVLDLLPYDRRSRLIVFNRSDSDSGLTAGDVEAMVKSPIAGYLPSRVDVPASTNHGVPLASAQPDHVVSQAVRRLADTLVATDGRSSRDPPER